MEYAEAKAWVCKMLEVDEPLSVEIQSLKNPDDEKFSDYLDSDRKSVV